MSTEEFFLHIYKKQKLHETVSSNAVIEAWANNLLNFAFPERSEGAFSSQVEVRDYFIKLEKELVRLLNVTKACNDCNNEEVAHTFFEMFPEIYRKMNTDIDAIQHGDPAAKSTFEIVRAYPGFIAIAFYRIANVLLKLDVPLIPRLLTELAHSKTGIDIHPGATIGDYLCIDHGTGIVIGETTVIGNHVKIYQGVTLGALSVDKKMVDVKRHPTIEDHVILYAGATILGGDTIVGSHCTIGGNVWLTRSVPPYATVYHQPTIKVIEAKNKLSS